MTSPARLRELLKLEPHPEGGWYREVYRSPSTVVTPGEDGSARSAATLIYYLLEAGQFSTFHRIRGEEFWHLLAGGPLELHWLDSGPHVEILGLDFEAGQRPQAVIRSGVWQAARLSPGAEYALVGCSVAPGFDFRDFEIATADRLLPKYPTASRLIRELTRA